MKRLQFLDSLRGLAALYVGVYHTPIFYDPGLALLPDWLRPFHGFGGSGVTLFFVISAFSLCLTMPRHQTSAYPTAHYWISRVFRIVPLFYAMLIVYAGLHLLVLHNRLPADLVLQNVALIFNLVPERQAGIVSASWTIGVEVIFYAAFPVLYLAGSTIWRKFAMLAGSLILFLLGPRLLALVLHDPAQLAQYTSLWFPRFFPVFMVGMVAFDVLRHAENLSWRWGAAGIALGLLGLALSMYGVMPSAPLDGTHVWAVEYMLLLVGVALCPLRPIVNRVTAYYGKISYSFYLLHPVVIYWLLAPVHTAIAGCGLPPAAIYFACVAATIAAVTPLAALSYVLVEKPGISLGHMLLRRLGLRAGPPLASIRARPCSPGVREPSG